MCLVICMRVIDQTNLLCGFARSKASQEVMAVIGIVTLFQGLVAVCINETGPIMYRPSLLEDATIRERCVGQRNGLLVSYWLSGTISNKNGCRVAWNIAQNDGKVYCWSVPCRNDDSRHCLSVEQNVRGMCLCQIVM